MTRTRRILGLLRDYESPNILAIEPDLSAPMIWERARGAHVWDGSGRKYLDLTAAFGVAAAGHANPRVVAAGRRQMGLLLHAMGDVYPHARKAELARELSRVTFERWSASRPQKARLTGKTIFTNSGFEAVEAALKTAVLATGRHRIVAFTGAYHGLGYGALNATHREHFRGPFRRQLGGFSSVARFPKSGAELAGLERHIRKLSATRPLGAVLAEPIQARGGIRVPPAGFLPLLRGLCDEFGTLLILDEIYTGFGRTGQWFACEHSATVPDLICLGKALTGGFPLSACVGRAGLMDAAWPRSTGEAIHTSTFLGHPVGCAMALAQIREIAEKNLPERSAALGAFLLQELRAAIGASKYKIEIRGAGLMAGVEIRRPDGSLASAAALGIVRAMLRAGFIVLAEGQSANVISFTPPLTVTRSQLAAATRALREAIAALPAT